MQLSVYQSIYTHLDNLQALYSNSGTKMCSLAYVCENLAPILEGLGNNQPEIFAVVRGVFIAFLEQMFDIVFREENDDVREEGLEDLDEVLSALDKQVH
ncbi:hypothetical protein TNCV_4975081 [Trichonephila clavipes]|uniref:Uncharacterized protein n=1 Tax=Trichonephila clavipes TaxID=2585209 RepID=A0A8X6VL88_TRICX|nr:hypothetical protein TNCV_4975081 [Trichonephila clavipes]